MGVLIVLFALFSVSKKSEPMLGGVFLDSVNYWLGVFMPLISIPFLVVLVIWGLGK